jgi:hypothetical protein
MKNDKPKDAKKKAAAGAPGEAETSAIAQAAAVAARTVPPVRRKAPPARINMLRAMVAFLSIFWILGIATSYTLDGTIHILLVLAMVLLITDRLVPPKST